MSYSILLVSTILLVACGLAIRVLFPTKRYPDAPWLRVSTKPGQLGRLEDFETYKTDPMSILTVGWERYSKNGINYNLDSPEGHRYIVAQKYFVELTSAPDTHVSALAAANQVMQIRNTLHPMIATDSYHFDLPIRKSLTQALSPKLADIVDEAKLAINAYIGPAKEWTAHTGLSIFFDIVTRTANRLLFNIPLARNKEFHRLSVDYTFVMFGGADIVRTWPNILKPLVIWWSTKIYSNLATARRILLPILEDRVREEKKARANGNPKDRKKEDDMIQWVLDYSPDDQLVPGKLVYRMLHINIAAVHTSSTTFADIMYSLALKQQYIPELREEIITIFRQEGGWSKQTLTLLSKMDSYITEVGRLLVNGYLKNGRIAVKDWQFKDGTKIPKGTYMLTNQMSVALSEKVFEDPYTFDPWRMHKERAKEGQTTKHQYVMTSEKNLHFGHGKHACPGRFFAANELKTLFAIMLMRFDVRVTNVTSEEVEHGISFCAQRTPLEHAKMEFKDRSDQIPEDLKQYFI